MHTHTHTHVLMALLQVSQYQKGRINLDFTEARDSEWQWHQLGYMQVCTSLQTDNHASTPPLSFLQAGCPSCRLTNSIKALKAPHAVMTYTIQQQQPPPVLWPLYTSTCVSRHLQFRTGGFCFVDAKFY